MNDKFRSHFALVIGCFQKTCIVLNAGKYTENATLNFNDKNYSNSREEIILGIEIDNVLSCFSHIKELHKRF